LLATNDEAKQFYDEMTKLDQILEEDKFQPKEINLTDSIMDEINQSHHAQKVGAKGNIWNKLFPDPRWNVAYSLILGVIIGFLLFSPLIRPDLSSSDFDIDEIGTMYDANAKPAFEIPVELENINARFTAYHLANDFVKVVVEMTSEKEARARFSFNKNDFNVWTYKVLEQKFDCRILTGYGSVEVINTGKNTYLILLKKLNHLQNEIKVEIFSEDQSLYQDILTIKQQNN